MNRLQFLEASGATLALLNSCRAVGALALQQHGISLRARLNRYENTLMRATVAAGFDPAQPGRLEMLLDGSRWSCAWRASPVADRPDAIDLTVRLQLDRGALANAAAAIEVEFADWSIANYICIPGAVYNGTRCEPRRMPYPPLVHDPQDIGPHVPPIISDIPRLNIHLGTSRIQPATVQPAIGYEAPAAKTGFWLLTLPSTAWGDSGLDIEECHDCSRALFRVTAPCVPQGTCTAFATIRCRRRTAAPFSMRAINWTCAFGFTCSLRKASSICSRPFSRFAKT